jgi:hypothetical protein
MNKFDEPDKRPDVSAESKESEPKTWTAPSLTIFDIGEETLGIPPSGSPVHIL